MALLNRPQAHCSRGQRPRTSSRIQIPCTLMVAGLLAAVACSDREHLNPLDPENPETAGVPWRFTAVAENHAVNLRWDVQDFPDLGSFHLIRSTAGRDSMVFTVGPLTGSYRDGDLDNGSEYTYLLVPHLVDGRELMSDGPAVATPGPQQVWVADTGGFEVVRVAPDGRAVAFRRGGFRSPNSVAVSPRDGLVWIADSFNRRIVALDSAGATVREVGGFVVPKAVSVSPADGTIWVADERDSSVTHLSPGGDVLGRFSGLAEPTDVAANPSDGTAWAADGTRGEVLRVAADGTLLLRVGGFGQPLQLAAVHADTSCWIADYDLDRVLRLHPDGRISQAISPVPRPFGIAVHQSTEDLWVGSFAGGTIERYTTHGGRIDLIVRVSGFSHPLGLAVDPVDAGIWVVESETGAIAKLTTGGHEVGRARGFSLPFDVDVGLAPARRSGGSRSRLDHPPGQ